MLIRIFICAGKDLIPVMLDREGGVIQSLAKGAVPKLREYGWQIARKPRKKRRQSRRQFDDLIL